MKVGQEQDWGLASLIPRVGGPELGTGQHTLVAKCSQHQPSAWGDILEVTTCSSHLRMQSVTGERATKEGDLVEMATEEIIMLAIIFTPLLAAINRIFYTSSDNQLRHSNVSYSNQNHLVQEQSQIKCSEVS